MEYKNTEDINEYCVKVNCTTKKFYHVLNEMKERKLRKSLNQYIELAKEKLLDIDYKKTFKMLELHYNIDNLDYESFYEDFVLNRLKRPSRNLLTIIKMTVINYPNIESKVEEYKIDGKTLIQISMENNFAYETLLKRIDEMSEEFPLKDIDFITKLAVSVMSDNFNFGYRCKEYHLYKLCKIDSLDYLKLVELVDELKEQYPNAQEEVLVKCVLEIQYQHIVYDYIKYSLLKSNYCKIEYIDYFNLINDVLIFKDLQPTSKITMAIDKSIVKNVVLESKVLDDETREIEVRSKSVYLKK